MKQQAWKRVLSLTLAMLMVIGGLYIPEHAQKVSATDTEYIVYKDFEDGVTTGFTGYDTKFEIQELNGNKVLAVTHAGTTNHSTDGVWYALSGITDSATLSYNVMYTASSDDYLLSFSKGSASTGNQAHQQYQLVRLENRANDTSPIVRWYSSNSNQGNVTVDGSRIAFANNVWHSVKIACTRTEGTWSADVYIDGELTNAGANLSDTDITSISMRWQSGTTGRTIYLDNIRVTESDHEAYPINHSSISFEKGYYSVNTGETVTVKANGNNVFDAVVYSSSDSTVATVDSNTGVVTGLKSGEVTITAASVTDPSVKASTSLKVLYYQYMDGTATDGWKEVNTSNTVKSENGELVYPMNTAKGTLYYTLPAALGNVELSYRIKLSQVLYEDYLLALSKSNGYTITDYAVRMQARSEAYGGLWGYKDDTYYNAKFVDGSRINLADDTWYAVKIIYINGSAEVYINDQKTNIGANLDSASISYIALRGNGNKNTVYLDDITIKEIVEPFTVSQYATLGANIDMRFPVDALQTGAKVQAILNGETVDEATEVGQELVVPLAAAQMNETITLQAVDAGGAVLDSKECSLKVYLETLQAQSTGTTLELVEQTLNYGAAADAYFNGAAYTAPEGLTAVPAADTTSPVSGTLEGVKAKSANLLFQDQVYISYKLEAESLESLTIKINGEDAEVVSAGNVHYVYSKGINPQDYGTDMILTVTDGSSTITVTYCALDYISRKASSANMKDLLTAMYNYYLAASAYVG